MIQRNWQRQKAAIYKLLGKIIEQQLCIQLASPGLSSHFPCRSRRDKQFVACIRHAAPGLCRECRVVGKPPQNGMRVEQQPHYIPQRFSSAAVIGLKNDAETVILPRKRPGWRRLADEPRATRRATGFLPRAMITSLPF